MNPNLNSSCTNCIEDVNFNRISSNKLVVIMEADKNENLSVDEEAMFVSILESMGVESWDPLTVLAISEYAKRKSIA